MREPFYKTRTYLTTLLTLEVCLGIGIIIVTVIYHRTLSVYLGPMERKLLGGQYFNTYSLGFQLIMTYLCSMALWKRLWLRRYTPDISLLIAIWMYFCFLIVLCGLGTIWSLYTCAEAFEHAAETSLMQGIDLYYTCPEWKLLWDGLQYHKECCGVHDYKDWMKASWMPPEEPDEEEECSPMTDRKTNILAPYACCKHSCTNCYENYIPRAGNSGIPYLNLTDINIEGCLPRFSAAMWQIMYVLLALMIIAFKLDLIICCLCKYIIRKQSMDYCGGDNMGLTDDEGRPLVIVKCPPNVRCVTVEDEEDTSYDHLAPQEETHPHSSFSGIERSYTVKQEVTQVSPTCRCGVKITESRILH